jgi:hypothetical protein
MCQERLLMEISSLDQNCSRVDCFIMMAHNHVSDSTIGFEAKKARELPSDRFSG